MFITILMYVAFTVSILAAAVKLQMLFRASLIFGVVLSALIAGLSGGAFSFFSEIGRFVFIALSISLVLALVEHIHAAWVFRSMSIPRTSQLKTLKGRSQVFYATFVKYLKKLWLAE